MFDSGSYNLTITAKAYRPPPCHIYVTQCQHRSESTSAHRSKNPSAGRGRQWSLASGRGSARGITPSPCH
jgi:hypothetical protein